MARYQYAKNENGEIVKAVDLVGQEVKTEYTCLGCDNLLIEPYRVCRRLFYLS